MAKFTSGGGSRGKDYELRRVRMDDRMYGRKRFVNARRCPKCGHKKNIWFLNECCFECQLLFLKFPKV